MAHVSSKRCRTKGRVLATATLLAGFAMQGPANAHPHVWIQAETAFKSADDGLVSGLSIAWRFDEFYSVYAVEGLDADGDGAYSAEELSPLAQENVEALAEWDYFTFVTVDGEPIEIASVESFSGAYEDGHFTLTFDVAFDAPVNPRLGIVSLKMYDPSFYVSIMFETEEALSFQPQLAGCSTEISPPGETLDVANLANLSEAMFTQVNEGMGASFAETVTVHCE